jgi:hypothetical protein
MEQDDLQEVRCRSCGYYMGHRRRIGKFIFWCSEDCADTPMAKWEESQVRDEVIVELFLQGTPIMDICRAVGDETPWPHQYVQKILARRGLQRREFKIRPHQVRTNGGKEIEVKERRVLVRSKVS